MLNNLLYNFVIFADEESIPIWGGVLGMILFLLGSIFFLWLFWKKYGKLKAASEYDHLPFWTRSVKSVWPVMFLMFSAILFLSAIAMLILIV